MSAGIAQSPVFFPKMKIYARKLGKKTTINPFMMEADII